MRGRGPGRPPIDREPDEPFEADEAPAEETDAERIIRLRAEIAEHGREWRSMVRGSGNPPPRAYQLQELMHVKSAMIEQLEPEVTLDVPQPVRGREYVVGERSFPPGRYTVKASVAEYLRWMIDQDRIAEVRRMHTLTEQRQLDPMGLEGILDPGVQTNRALGNLQG